MNTNWLLLAIGGEGSSKTNNKLLFDQNKTWLNERQCSKKHAQSKLLGFTNWRSLHSAVKLFFYFQCSLTANQAAISHGSLILIHLFEFMNVLHREEMILTFCFKLWFWCWVFFQEPQTGQPSNNFPSFFDLFTAYCIEIRCFYFFHSTVSTFCCLFVLFWCWDNCSRNSNRSTEQQFPMVLRFESTISTYWIKRRCFNFFTFEVF